MKRFTLKEAFDQITRLPYATIFTLWFVLAILFGFFYFALAVFVPAHGPTQLVQDQIMIIKLFDAIYYSIITATSTGYGDITPQGFSKALASLQSIMALMLFAIFVTKLVSHKQELALREVHRLTFEDVFHNTREGLFIIRKDCDRIIRDAEEHRSLTDDHWQDLIIAYRQAQSLLQDIPEFYATDKNNEGLYTIDQKREQLLHEAVQRTLKRINQMLDTLSRNNIDWWTQEEGVLELKNLLQVVDNTTSLWEQESPYTSQEAFADILHINGSIHNRLEHSIPGAQEDVQPS